MNDNHTMLDGLAGAIWTLFFGVVIFGVFRLLMLAYVYLTAVVWALLSELVWPLLRSLFREVGIALLRAYNLLTSSFSA